MRIIRSGDIRIGLSKTGNINDEVLLGEDSDSWGYQFGATDEMHNIKVAPGSIVGCMFD